MNLNISKNSLKALVLSGLGVIVNYIALKNAELHALIWHVFPYIFSLVLFFILNSRSMIGGILLMLFVDLWLLTEGAFGTKSSFLMMFAVMSAFKIIVLFPLGTVFGYFYFKKTE